MEWTDYTHGVIELSKMAVISGWVWNIEETKTLFSGQHLFGT